MNTAEMELIAAKNVLRELEAGRSVDPQRVEWAREVVARGSPTQLDLIEASLMEVLQILKGDK